MSKSTTSKTCFAYGWVCVARKQAALVLPAQHLPCALLTGDGLAEGGTRPGRGSALPASLFGACVLQVAEMHGELIEFNERLHRALVAKEALVSQMRQELIDLRGPVSVVPRAPTRPTPSVCPPTPRRRPPAHLCCPQHCSSVCSVSRVQKSAETKRGCVWVGTIQMVPVCFLVVGGWGGGGRC